jgi:hypothetical protein
MHKYLFIVCLYFMCNSVVQAQSLQDTLTVQESISIKDEIEYAGEDEDEKDAFVVDTFLVKHRVNINPDSIRHWQNAKQFAYIKNLDSLLRATQANVKAEEYKPSFLERLFRSNIFALLAWMLGGFVILLIIYQLIRNNGLFASNKSVKKLVEAFTPGEHIELAHDFDLLMEQAYHQGDYRLAVRYAFLKNLKQLRKIGYIDFAIDKTNTKYLQEVPAQLRPGLKSLIHDYEYVWYGHHGISKEQYAIIQKKFAAFEQHLQ